MMSRSPLAEYVDTLQSRGRYTFVRDEALAALGVSTAALKQAAARLVDAGRLVSPRRGFYVIVPLEHRVAGAPPPSWYIADLLRHADVHGYVGLLSAAALYDAAHHAPQEYQVVVDRQLRHLTVGRSRFRFVYKRDTATTLITHRKTDTGTMPVSTPEATAFDLVRYVEAAGGIDAVATVLADLGEQIEPQALASAAVWVPRTVAQRVGWLLDRLGHGERTGPLHRMLAACAWDVVDLQPGMACEAEPDPRWHVRANRDIEVDE